MDDSVRLMNFRINQRRPIISSIRHTLNSNVFHQSLFCVCLDLWFEVIFHINTAQQNQLNQIIVNYSALSFILLSMNQLMIQFDRCVGASFQFYRIRILWWWQCWQDISANIAASMVTWRYIVPNLWRQQSYWCNIYFVPASFADTKKTDRLNTRKIYSICSCWKFIEFPLIFKRNEEINRKVQISNFLVESILKGFY